MLLVPKSVNEEDILSINEDSFENILDNIKNKANKKDESITKNIDNKKDKNK